MFTGECINVSENRSVPGPRRQRSVQRQVYASRRRVSRRAGESKRIPKGERHMARVLVTDDAGTQVLWEEHVKRVHLDDEHSGRQVVQRLAWAVADADRAVGALVPYRGTHRRRPARRNAA